MAMVPGSARQPRGFRLRWLLWQSIFLFLLPPVVCADSLPPPEEVLPAEPALTVEQAVFQALLNNPQLATVRRQHGIAAAGIVIADTYPFNPLYQMFVLADGGPAGAGITNRVFNEHTVRIDLEVRGQGKHRRAAARAALSRAEWDIATQEVLIAVNTIRAFNTVLHREGKLKVLDATVALNQQAVEQVSRLAATGRLRQADLILARSDVGAARSLLGQGRTTLAVARADLRRLLGSLEDSLAVAGSLDLPAASAADADALTCLALQQRPDLRSRQAAVAEAEARWRLEKANRFGNPSVGPATEYNETRVYFVGIWVVTPLPLLNTRRGEIQQREAEIQRARQELTQFEVQARQEVRAALARLSDAQAWAESYRKEVLPDLERARKEMEKLFARGEPGVDALRIFDMRRRLLKAYDGYLDALLEVSQARADLAAAVGDPSLAVPGLPCASEPAKGQP
jgi:outer membrane protein, heavy metal efflux system